ncbi:30S ribosomal protein S12 methylthiotransferase RimO [Ectothiorhodospiraceae bacterium BW-2]|nr:30S ribosomal protein S12 methylthiotransferase RimO [Ectothiorhodospiraceae bacterium BW-2]
MSGAIGFISLGCPKATVDSERILTRLRAEGYQFVNDYSAADLVIVNTCGFIDAAIEESLATIGEALQESGKVVVTGCLGAKTGVVEQAHPQVLAVTGPDSAAEVVDIVHRHLPPEHDPLTALLPAGGVKLTPRHYAYLKIAEGCNQRCSFCIIPSLRGPLVSRPLEAILTEASALVDDGVRELLIVAQDTAAYGVDKRYQAAFWRGRPLKSRIETLVAELGELGAWIRLHYLYPYPHLEALIELMSDSLILPYLDMPLQHASAPLLKAMRRPAKQENILRRIESWRQQLPHLTLRSTFIVGFPGESEADFEQLLDFLAAAQLDRVGAFTYSAVDGAVANRLPNPVPEALKQERLERFMELQSAISANRLQQRIGEQSVAIIDEALGGQWVGRTPAEAPEIDGVVWLDSREPSRYQAGDVVDIEVTAADEHDLFATIVS